MGGQRRTGAFGNLLKTLDQLLRGNGVMQPLCRTHVGMVEAVQIVAAVENHEGIVDMFRSFQGFADGAGVAELPGEFQQAGLFCR